MTRSLFRAGGRIHGLLFRGDPPAAVIVAVDQRSFWIHGWLREPWSILRRLEAIAPDGTRTQLLGRVFRYPDAENVQPSRTAGIEGPAAGNVFGGYVEVEQLSGMDVGWEVEIDNGRGSPLSGPVLKFVRDPVAGRDTVLAALNGAVCSDESVMEVHVVPAISRLQEQCRSMIELAGVERYGEPVGSADIAVIVYLGDGPGLPEHQLAQFAQDPEMQGVDLLYVLDLPGSASSVKDSAPALSSLYRVPFQLVTLKRAVGCAAATNLAASLARGRLLVLLGSAALPDRPGWLGRMAAFHNATRNVGAIGPKLLRKDDSVEQVGISFKRLAGSGVRLWERRQLGQGGRRHAPLASVSRRLPAVSGACLMTARDLYQRMGGYRDTYVTGRYADADLCLRLVEAGYENWYVADVELYCLDGLDQGDARAAAGALYDRWLFSQLWRDRLEALADVSSSAPASGLPEPHVVEIVTSVVLRTLEVPADLLPLREDTELLGGGVGADSIDALRLVAALEEEFAITVGDEDLSLDNFERLGAIVRLVQRLSEQRYIERGA